MKWFDFRIKSFHLWNSAILGDQDLGVSDLIHIEIETWKYFQFFDSLLWNLDSLWILSQSSQRLSKQSDVLAHFRYGSMTGSRLHYHINVVPRCNSKYFECVCSTQTWLMIET